MLAFLCFAIAVGALVDFGRLQFKPWRADMARAGIRDALLIHLALALAGGPGRVLVDVLPNLRDLTFRLVAWPLWLLYACEKTDEPQPVPGWEPHRARLARELAFAALVASLTVDLLLNFAGVVGLLAAATVVAAAAWTNIGYVLWLARLALGPPYGGPIYSPEHDL